MQQSAGFNPTCLHAGQVRKPAYEKTLNQTHSLEGVRERSERGGGVFV